MTEGNPAEDGPRSIDTGLAYTNQRDKKPATLSFRNPARLPDGVIDAMPGIPGNHDFKRLTTNDTEHMGPVDPEELMSREEHKDAFRDFVLAPLDDEAEVRRNQANSYWYDLAKNFWSPNAQALDAQIDRNTDDSMAPKMTGEQFNQQFGALKKAAEESAYSFIDTAVETPLKMTAAALYGMDNFAKDHPFYTNSRTPDAEEAQKNIEEFFEWANLQPPDREQPSKEERIQAVEEEVKERADRFQIDLSEIPEGERRLARNLVRETEKNSQALHSKAAAAGEIGSNIMQAGTALFGEIAAYSKILSMFPKASRSGLMANTIASAGSGFVGGSVAQFSPNKTPEEVVWDGVQGSALNLAFDGAVVGVATGIKKGLVPGLRKVDDMLNSSVDPKKLGNIKRKVKEFESAYTGDANESTIRERALELKDELTTLDEISDAYPTKIRRKFRSLFRTDDAGQTDRAMEQVLNYKYGKKNIDDLDPEEKLDFDAWMHQTKENTEFFEWEEIIDRVDDDLQNLDTDKKMQDFLDQSSFLNEDAIQPDKLRKESPFMKNLLDFGEGSSDSLESLIRQTEEIHEPPLRSSIKGLTKAVGPRHILAKQSQEASVNDVPLVTGYWDVQLSHRNAFKKFNKGIELPDGTKIPGAEKIDQVFKENGMYMKENWEKQEELFDFLIHKEYDPSQLTDEEMAKAGLDEQQRNVANFIRDTFDKLGKATDVEPDRLIRNYVPRRLNVKNQKQAKAVIDDTIEIEESFFQKNRNIGELTLEDMRELERNGVEFKKDMQEGMRSYLFSFLRKNEVEPALGKFDDLVKRLKAEDHPDAKTWEQWADEMRGRGGKEMTAGRRLMKGIADQIEGIDPTSGKRFTNWVSNNRPSDAFMQATYGNYLFGKQFFRLKNVSQSALTVLERGAENVAEAHNAVRKNSGLVDEILSKSNIRNEQDQFLDVSLFGNTDEAAGKGMLKKFKDEISDKLLSYDNISASDAFNSRRAFLSGPMGLSRHLKNYKNGELTFKQLADQAGFETMRPVPKSILKRRVDEGRVGAILTGDGERLTIREALERGKDELGNFELDEKSAEFMLGRNTLVDTQWEYGKGAMGHLYWQEEGPLSKDMELWTDWMQGLALPFTTWMINYGYKGMKWAKQPNVNAGKMIAYTTLGKAYTDAVGQVFETNTDNWLFNGPLQGLNDIFAKHPGMKAFRAGMNILLSEPSRGLAEVENLTGRNEDLPWYTTRSLNESYRVLTDLVAGEGTAPRRAVEVVKPVFDSAAKAFTEGGMDGQDMIQSLEGIIGQEFVQEARNGSRSARDDVLETLQDKGGSGGSDQSVLETLQND